MCEAVATAPACSTHVAHMPVAVATASAMLIMRARLLPRLEVTMAASSHQKLLRSLSGIGGVSDRTISTILSWVGQHPEILEKPAPHQAVSKAATSGYKQCGPARVALQSKKGAPVVVEFLEIQTLLPFLCEEAPEFCELLRETRRAFPSTWRLILYTDGITPGSLLCPDNLRKSNVFYVSFLEFGIKLCYEELWLSISVVRTSVCKTLAGGCSAVYGMLLRSMFIGPQSVKLVGVSLPIGEGGACELLRIDYHALLADEAALSDCHGIKGSPGLVPCAIVCSCVRKPRAADLEAGVSSLTELDESLADITCSDQSRMGLKSDKDVWDLCDALSICPQKSIKEMEVSTGINFIPQGYLFDLELRPFVRPATSNRFDAMHVVFSNGILGLEVMLFLRDSLAAEGIYFASVRRCVGLSNISSCTHARTNVGCQAVATATGSFALLARMCLCAVNTGA